MDIHKEFSLLLVTYETLLADYDLERIDFAQAEEQAFKHFDLITEFIRQEERERARKIIEEEIIYFGRIVGTYLPSSSLTIPLSEHVKKMDGLAERCEEEMKEWDG